MRELHELYWLALTIWLEARGEDIDGQIGVAFVIMNRVRARKQSLIDVCLAPFQFSSFNTKDPNRSRIDDAPFTPVWMNCLKAASAAYFGLVKDPTNGATDYLNPKALDKLPNWYDKTKIVASIGKHEFLKVS